MTIRKLATDHLHWSSFPAMSVERAKAAHHANGEIFIIAGGEDINGAALKSAEVYSEGSWSAISNMPTATKGYARHLFCSVYNINLTDMIIQ